MGKKIEFLSSVDNGYHCKFVSGFSGTFPGSKSRETGGERRGFARGEGVKRGECILYGTLVIRGLLLMGTGEVGLMAFVGAWRPT